MRKLIALVAILPLFWAFPAKAQRVCENWSFVNIAGTAGPTEFIAATQGVRIHLCGYVLTAAGNSLDFQLWAGRGTNCSVDPTPITPVLQIGQGANLVNRIPYAAERTPEGYALCAQTTGATNATLAAIVYWSIF